MAIPDLSRYHDPSAAAAYRGKFRRSWLRRFSARLERRLLERVTAPLGPISEMLDVPCGAGRLVPLLKPKAARLVCVDFSRAMLGEARAAAGPAAARWAQGSALSLPFRDGAFDVVVCWRLIHHFADPAVRAKLLRELRRVARRAVILTFADAGTLRGRLRGTHRRDGRPRGRTTLSASRLAEEARAAGLAIEARARLAGWFSFVAAARLRPL